MDFIESSVLKELGASVPAFLRVACAFMVRACMKKDLNQERIRYIISLFCILFTEEKGQAPIIEITFKT